MLGLLLVALGVGFGLLTTALYLKNGGKQGYAHKGVSIYPCIICCESRRMSSHLFTHWKKRNAFVHFYSVGVIAVLLGAVVGLSVLVSSTFDR